MLLRSAQSATPELRTKTIAPLAGRNVLCGPAFGDVLLSPLEKMDSENSVLEDQANAVELLRFEFEEQKEIVKHIVDQKVDQMPEGRWSDRDQERLDNSIDELARRV